MSSTPINASPGNLQVTPDHTAMADRHLALERGLDKGNAVESAQAISRALGELEDFSRQDRERYLRGSMTQTGGNQAVSEWIATRYDHLGRLARKVVPYQQAADAQEGARLAPVWALAILLAGHASKWRKIAAMPPDLAVRGRLHKLFVSATSANADACILEVTVDRRNIETTVEALYVRAMLLERFAGGSLPPRRLEILDSWLLEWMGALWLRRDPIADGPSLGVDTRNPNLGFTRFHPGERADYFLGLRPLYRQLERATRDFHRGVIFPGWGIGLVFRMEDHVGVIEFLEREFASVEGASAQKSKRFAIGQGSEVAAFFGLNDICTRGLQRQSAITSTSAPQVRAMNDRGDILSVDAVRRAALSETGSFAAPRLLKKPIQLLDISETGLGLEMGNEDAALVPLDELVAVQIEEGKPCVLGIVVRKTAAQQKPATVVGIKVLSRVPLRAALEMVNDRLVRESTRGIFVVGQAEHGFADSIIVGDAIYKASPSLTATVASGMFHLRLGRVRQQGPGWKLVAVEARVVR
jgi:hypothetical protein